MERRSRGYPRGGYRSRSPAAAGLHHKRDRTCARSELYALATFATRCDRRAAAYPAGWRMRRARRSTIRLFQDSRCARMRGCNSQIGVTQPDPACLQHMQRGPHARSSCRRWPRLQRSPAISTRSAAHLLNAHQLFVQNFAADRDREKGVIAVLIVPPARQGACPCGG